MMENKQGPVSDSSMPLFFEEMANTLDSALAEESEEIKSIFKQSLGLLRKVASEKPEDGRLLIKDFPTEFASLQETQSDALMASLNSGFDHMHKTIVEVNDVDFDTLALGLETSISVIKSIFGNAVAAELSHNDRRELADMNNELMDASKSIFMDMIKGRSMAVEDDVGSMEALVSHVTTILEDYSKSTGAIAEYKTSGENGMVDLPGFIAFPLCTLFLAGLLGIFLWPVLIPWILYGFFLVPKCNDFPDLAACDVFEEGGMWDEKGDAVLCVGL
jgi:hypothetical protein